MVLPVFTPPHPAFQVARAPIMATLHQPSISGKDNPIQLQAYPRRRFTISFEFLRDDATLQERQYVDAFFNSVGGSAQAFYYQDPLDKSVTDQTFGVGDGVTTAFQLVRAETSVLGASFVELVYAPIGSPTIKKNAVTLSTPADYSISATGLVTFTSAPAVSAALTWTGSYYWICRFDSDDVEFSEFVTAISECKKLSFTTFKI